MSLLRRRSSGAVAIVLACTVLAAAMFYGLRQTGAYAGPVSPADANVSAPTADGGACLVPEDPLEATPVACANTACNSWCWADGTHPNQGTFAKFKIPTPAGCPPTGGCITLTCN